MKLHNQAVKCNLDYNSVYTLFYKEYADSLSVLSEQRLTSGYPDINPKHNTRLKQAGMR